MPSQDLFSPLIVEAHSHGYSVPREWQAYLRTRGISTTRKSPEFLAPDDLTKLNSQLRDANCMIFRLGAAGSGSKTHFSVVSCMSLEDQFISNQTVLAASSDQLFFPIVPARELFSFGLIPNATENGLINLALCAGIIDEALGIEQRATLPARGNSLYSFRVCPSSEQQNLALEHVTGQVEIDAVFLGKQSGVDTIFVVEAKRLQGRRGISKAKLGYSTLAVQSLLKFPLKVQTVYLLFDRPAPDTIRFIVAPCEWNTKFISDMAVDISKVRSYLLPASFGF